MENTWVSVSPHIKNKTKSNQLYLYILISLIPAVLFGSIISGFYGLLTLLASVASAIVINAVYYYIKLKKFVWLDYSAILTGVMMAVVMPTSAPFYYPIIANLFALIFIRYCFGGVGNSFVSEVAVGKLLIFTMFANTINNCYKPIAGSYTTIIDDLVNGVKPNGGFFKNLMGIQVGAIGETVVLFLLIAGIVLCVLKVIDYKTPVVYLLSTVLFAGIFFGFDLCLYFVLGGGVVFCAFYVATDYSTSPKTTIGKIVFGFLTGLVTVLIWKYGNYILAPYYAIALGQVVTTCVNGYVYSVKK